MNSRIDTGSRPGRLSFVNVVVIEPLSVVRSGLRLLICSEPDVGVVCEAANANEALEAIPRLIRRTTVVALVSLNLAGERDGYWLIREIRETFPGVLVLACGAHSDADAITRALFFGADGFVDKTAEPAAFLQAIRRCAARGDMVLEGVPPNWLEPLTKRIGRRRNGAPVLTGRETEVLTIAAEGLTARQIGSRLGVRERTVTTHLFRIYRKLGADNRIAAIAAAARSGLIDVSIR
jgi:DNA-binding NarL/FixJ family response regulator